MTLLTGLFFLKTRTMTVTECVCVCVCVCVCTEDRGPQSLPALQTYVGHWKESVVTLFRANDFY